MSRDQAVSARGSERERHPASVTETGARTIKAPSLVLIGARIVDARGSVDEPADVVVQDGRILEIVRPTAAANGPINTGIDLRGKTLCPGLTNAHSHICLNPGPDPEQVLARESSTETAVFAARRLQEVVDAGVTSLRDLGGPDGIDISLSRLVEGGELAGPRIQAAGRPLTMTGGHCHWMGIEADGPSGVRKAARAQIAAGASTLKLMATGGMSTAGQEAGAPQLTTAEMEAAVDEAHNAALLIAAHSESAVGTRNALAAGVDSIEHGHGLDEALIGQMLDRGTILVPTLLSDQRIIERGSTEESPGLSWRNAVACAKASSGPWNELSRRVCQSRREMTAEPHTSIPRRSSTNLSCTCPWGCLAARPLPRQRRSHQRCFRV